MMWELKNHTENVGDTTDRSSLFFQLWYLDKGCIVGTHEAIRTALKLLSSPEVRSFGYIFARIGAPSGGQLPPPPVRQALPCELRQNYDAGKTVLPAPIWSDLSMEREFSKQITLLQPLL